MMTRHSSRTFRPVPNATAWTRRGRAGRIGRRSARQVVRGPQIPTRAGFWGVVLVFWVSDSRACWNLLVSELVRVVGVQLVLEFAECWGRMLQVAPESCDQSNGCGGGGPT